MNRTRPLLTSAIALSVIGMTPCALAVDPAAPDEEFGVAARTDVYLDDSFEAVDAIARARRWAASRRWEEAARLLQETSDTAGDKLIRVEDDYYVGTRAYVNDLIASWPRDGIGAYRELHEREVEKVLAISDRRAPAETLDLFERFFCTEAAGDLADAIGQAALEAGDFALARRVYRRVLEAHPDRARHAPRYQAMLAIVAAMQKEESLPGAEDLGDPQTKLRFMGRNVTAAEVVRTVREDIALPRAPSSFDDWPTFGGGNARNRIVGCNVDELGLRWRFTRFDGPAFLGGDSAVSDDSDDSFRRPGEHARALTIHPAVSNGLLVARHRREIVALHLPSGKVAWRYNEGTDLDQEMESWETPPPAWNAPTIHEGRVFASLPIKSMSYFGYESFVDAVELVCLDLETGAELWWLERDDLGEDAKGISFDPAPLARGDRLYVVGRRRRSFGFEDCYLFCIDAKHGTLVFRTHIGSASTGMFFSSRGNLSIAAAREDTVFVCTNLGTIAAIAASNGAVRWLRLYDRGRLDTVNTTGWPQRETQLWHYNPVILTGDRIVALPTDARRILILRADDGKTLDSIPVADLGDAVTLLGVRDGLLCTAGREAVAYDIANRSVLFRAALPEDTELQGRGVWADDRLLLPAPEGIYAFNVSDGRRTFMKWDLEGISGNLLALPDRLIVAGDGTISAYVRKADIRARLQAAMAAAPTDPLPALELAEVSLNDGEYAPAMAALQETVKRAGGFLAPLEPGLTKRLFSDVLDVVTALAAHDELTPDRLDTLFGYASQTAPDPASHITYRTRFADLFERNNAPARAVRLHQQILSDRSLREILISTKDGSDEPAAIAARTNIARLIEQHGRNLYEPFERKARQLLNRAVGAGDQALLQRVVDTYPNSEAAPEALLAQADLYAEAGAHQEAAKTLGIAYHRQAKGGDRAALMRRIADEYEKAGKLAHAYRWLTKAAREHPGATVNHDGRTMTFIEYRRRLDGVRALVEPSRPAVHLPLARHEVREFEPGMELLIPRFADDGASVWNRAYLYDGQAIQAYDPRLTGPLWSAPADVRLKPELLLASEKTAVFATLYEVFALDVETGSRQWSHGEYPPQLEDDNADWEGAGAYLQHAVGGGRIVSVRDDGRLICTDLAEGTLHWEKQPQITATGAVCFTDEWFVYQGERDGRIVVFLLDAESGEQLATIPTERRRPADALFVTLDGRVMLVDTRSITSYDPEAGTRVWEIEISGRLQTLSVLVDVDAMYFSDNGRHITKIGLEDGKMLWRSQRVARAGDEGLTLSLVDGNLIATSESAVAALDPVAGLILWEGVTPDRPRITHRFLTQAYVAALNAPRKETDTEPAMYFYDHRNASGVVPREGGVLNLDDLDETDLRAILILNDALLIQTGDALHVWRR